MAKLIVAWILHDWVEPYKSMGGTIPVVWNSDHPRFKIGTRLDWGFVQSALKDGYEVTIKPLEKEEEEAKL